jgi:hypothetical protein
MYKDNINKPNSSAGTVFLKKMFPLPIYPKRDLMKAKDVLELKLSWFKEFRKLLVLSQKRF